MEAYNGFTDSDKWHELGLDSAFSGLEMEYFNQEEDGPDQYKGEWWCESNLPDGYRVVFGGTFGNYNSPGASMYTTAEVYGPDEHEEFHARCKELEAMPEFLESEQEDDGSEDDYHTTDHHTFTQYGKVVVTVPQGEDWRPYVLQHMEESSFFPNVWFVSDHGNMIPLDPHGDD